MSLVIFNPNTFQMRIGFGFTKKPYCVEVTYKGKVVDAVHHNDLEGSGSEAIDKVLLQMTFKMIEEQQLQIQQLSTQLVELKTIISQQTQVSDQLTELKNMIIHLPPVQSHTVANATNDFSLRRSEQ